MTVEIHFRSNLIILLSWLKSHWLPTAYNTKSRMKAFCLFWLQQPPASVNPAACIHPWSSSHKDFLTPTDCRWRSFPAGPLHRLCLPACCKESVQMPLSIGSFLTGAPQTIIPYSGSRNTIDNIYIALTMLGNRVSIYKSLISLGYLKGE